MLGLAKLALRHPQCTQESVCEQGPRQCRLMRLWFSEFLIFIGHRAAAPTALSVCVSTPLLGSYAFDGRYTPTRIVYVLTIGQACSTEEHGGGAAHKRG